MSVDRYQGWLLLAHPQLEDQLASLTKEVFDLSKKDSGTYRKHPKTKRLATLEKLLFNSIPSNPAHKLWLQGNTLGAESRSWRRAKFLEQYRLFFRFDQRAKIIVYGWVNDENSLRAYESKSDAYLVFSKMLAADRPPSTWVQLVEESNLMAPRSGLV